MKETGKMTRKMVKVNNKVNCVGIVTCINGSQYDGDWANDKRNGNGS